MDNLGFGCTQKYDKQWIEHQDSFNDLLAGLNQATGKSYRLYDIGYTDFHEPRTDPIDKVGCVSTIVILPNSTLPLLITETYKLDLGNEVKPVIRLADTVEVSSLEKTGSKLGHRYKKATRAKDISNATAKDMEVIIEINFIIYRSPYTFL